MELIIFIAALCVVGLLAMRFGYDSRPTAHSKEEDLASLGLNRDQKGSTLRDTRREAARLRSDHPNKTSPASQPIRRTVTRVLHGLVGRCRSGSRAPFRVPGADPRRRHDTSFARSAAGSDTDRAAS